METENRGLWEETPAPPHLLSEEGHHAFSTRCSRLFAGEEVDSRGGGVPRRRTWTGDRSDWMH